VGFSLFKKQPAGPASAPIPAYAASMSAAAPGEHAQAAGGGACCFFGPCQQTEGWQCTYTDTQGSPCLSWWCRDHVVFVSGAPFCRRHSSLANMLVERVGSLYQIPVPPVGDYALPLLLRLTDQLDEPLVKLLRHLFSASAQVRVADHAMIRERREVGAQSGWESVWTATSPAGYVATLSLRASRTEPPVVQLVRDGRLVQEAVPTWIANRDEDAWHQPNDAEFVNWLYGSLIATYRDASLAG